MLPPVVATVQQVDEQMSRLVAAAKHYDPALSQDGTACRMRMISQAQELIRSLTNPADMGAVHLAQANELVAVRTLLHVKAFRHIPPDGSISLSALSGAMDVQEALLERLLRMVVCTGFLRQLQNADYAHTKFSLAYASIPGPGMHFQLIYDESFLMIDNYHLFLEQKGYKETDDQRYSPYTWKSGQEGKMVWEVMAQTPERLHAFQGGLAHLSHTTRLTGFYDFGKLNTESDRPILVDVGGGAGHSILRILQAHPQLQPNKFILQELKEPLEQARTVLPEQVCLMEHDFFTQQPVKAARAYLLRFVMHDYSDTVCVEILKQIVPAMAPDSLILISDFCLPELVSSTDLPAVTMDITMLNMGGKERSERGLTKILSAAGLELVKAYHADVGFGAIIEARLA
ncbi:hypothetical protein H2200_006039 [Cladophialophora chaetospira]|uniref:O-methyltransferase C-terminal domain-containing protein n=1 Tax=Cladophialophora chaetospira TaxID=386627 RepID=A0AA38XAF3_9EURO|nr:hypothetical protein H2200_006039 [Cladophialophora chaetospira]